MTTSVDYTTLSAMACDTKAALRHVLGLVNDEEDESMKLVAGTETHRMLEQVFKGMDWHDALVGFQEHYGEWANKHVQPHLGLKPWFEPYTTENLSAILERWCELRLPLESGSPPIRINPDLVEIGFQLPLSDEITFTGRLDAIVERQGHLYVMDHKTTGKLDSTWATTYALDAQMTGYVWAAQQTLGIPIRGIIINAIEFSKLPGSSKKCPRHNMAHAECSPEHAKMELLVFDRSEYDLGQWHATAMGLAQRYAALVESVRSLEDIHAVDQQGTFNKVCKWCQFATFCSRERNAPALLHADPWNPLRHEV